MGIFTWLVVSGAVAAVLCGLYLSREPPLPNIPDDAYWGAGDPQPGGGDHEVRPFMVEVPESVIKDLHRRLDDVRVGHTELEHSFFHYGMRPSVMKDVVKYWRHEYNWTEQQTKLNSLPQFVTNIEGIDLHFIQVKPRHKENRNTAHPLLLLHGWPGSVWEFYKLIPLLTDPEQGQAFEVICPSLPGYGFSEAPHKQGMSPLSMAAMFVKLMRRLGHDKFYTQGGDWGAVISLSMAQAYPQSLLGAHMNLIAAPFLSVRSILTQISMMICPSLLLYEDEQPRASELNMNMMYMLKEGGYIHLHATKPDTLAFALNDSPVGLAAYILEKFSSWTNLSHRDLDDGGLTSKFTMDELLTNVMIYWVNGNIGSSIRIYKEFFGSSFMMLTMDSVPVKVPVGLASFPHDLFYTPRVLAATRFKDIVQYSIMPRGGHFAAFEEPHMLADDIISFVLKKEMRNY